LRLMASNRHGKRNATFLVCILMLLLSASSTTTFFGIALSPISTASAVPSPIFGMTLIIPQGDPVKVAWAELLWMNLRQLGINCTKVYMSMSEISSRVLAPSSSVIGKTYDDGGFDAIILGFQLPLSPDPYLLYDSSQLAPNGMNYYLWNDTYSDQLCSLIRLETNATKRLVLELNWTSYVMDILPSTAVFYANGTVILNASLDIMPFQVLTYPIWPAVERWSGNYTALGNSVILAQPKNATNLIPVFSSSYYDAAIMNPVYGPAGFGLFQLSDMGAPRSYIPCMAQSYDWSADYRNWTIKVRNDVTFQDGVTLTGDDVIFTLKAYMTPILNSPMYRLFVDVFGSNSSISLGVNSSMIEIRLPKPYAYLMDLLSVPILPEHILAYIPYNEWRTSPLNTGIPSTVKLLNGTEVYLTGPVGAGPYRYCGYNETIQNYINSSTGASYSKTIQTYHLEKYDNYFNKDTLEAEGLFQARDYYVRIVDRADEAVQDYGSGRVDVLDMQYHLELLSSLKQFMQSAGGHNVTFSSLSVQELGFNMRHPILGTGLDTPLGTIDHSRAAEAANYVRKAIACAIPREAIIAQLLQGYGVPGRTSVFCPLNEGYNESIPLYQYNLTRAADYLTRAGYHPASIVPGFWESYGTIVLVIAAGAISVVALFILLKTRRIFKVRKPKIE